MSLFVQQTPTRFTMLAHLPREDGYRHGHSYVSRAELIPD